MFSVVKFLLDLYTLFVHVAVCFRPSSGPVVCAAGPEECLKKPQSQQRECTTVNLILWNRSNKNIDTVNITEALNWSGPELNCWQTAFMAIECDCIGSPQVALSLPSKNTCTKKACESSKRKMPYTNCGGCTVHVPLLNFLHIHVSTLGPSTLAFVGCALNSH